MNSKSRGIYTGGYTFAVREKGNNAVEVFCYDNVKDPNQMNRIFFDEMETSLGTVLKNNLEELLKSTNDR